MNSWFLYNGMSSIRLESQIQIAPAIRHGAGFPAVCSGPYFIAQFLVAGILYLVIVRLPPQAMLPRGHIGLQDGIHAREMAFALRLEPFEHVSINAQMHR